MKELSRPTATLREEDTLIETSSRGFFTRIIRRASTAYSQRDEPRLPHGYSRVPRRATLRREPGIGTKCGWIFDNPDEGITNDQKRPHEKELFLVTVFTELTLLKLVGSV